MLLNNIMYLILHDFSVLNAIHFLRYLTLLFNFLFYFANLTINIIFRNGLLTPIKTM